MRALKCANVAKNFVYALKAVPPSRQDLSVAKHVVGIITGLLDSPPALSDIANLMETALLLHESSLTFVPHSKSNFYFLIGESFRNKKAKKSPSKKNRSPPPFPQALFKAAAIPDGEWVEEEEEQTPIESRYRIA